MSKTEKSKGYSLFVDGKLVAKGSRESFSAKYGVSLATVDTWVRKGRLPLRKRMPLKHAVPFGYENSDEVPPVRKSPGKKGIAKKSLLCLSIRAFTRYGDSRRTRRTISC